LLQNQQKHEAVSELTGLTLPHSEVFNKTKAVWVCKTLFAWL